MALPVTPAAPAAPTAATFAGSAQNALESSSGTPHKLGTDLFSGLAGQSWLANSHSTVHMEVEARDPRQASDLVLQLLAWQPAAASEHGGSAGASPQQPCSMYFTYQLFSFPPTCTATAALGPSTSSHSSTGGGAATAAARMLVPLGTPPQAQSSVGLTMKHAVDGSVGLPSSGQSPSQAAWEQHMQLVAYLAAHSLVVDMWDGESLMQVGAGRLWPAAWNIVLCRLTRLQLLGAGSQAKDAGTAAH